MTTEVKTEEKKRATKKTSTTSNTTKMNKEIEDLKNQLAALQSQLAEAVESKTYSEKRSETELMNYDGNRRVKVISCVPCRLNLTTESKGGGIKYVFPYFGYVQNIRLTNLEKCVHENRRSFERGDCYICDPLAVAELDLSEAYQSLYTAEELRDIILLKHADIDIEKICGMGVYDEFKQEFVDTSSRDRVVDSIVENLAKGVNYDMNLIYKLSEKLNINLIESANKYKEVMSKM